MPISPTDIRNWTIYRITSPVGKIYIGLTSNLGIKQSPEQIEKRISKIRGLKRVKVGDMFISYKKHTFQRRVFNLTA